MLGGSRERQTRALEDLSASAAVPAAQHAQRRCTGVHVRGECGVCLSCG